MGAVGHGAWLVLVEPGHEPLPVAPAMGAVAVEVPPDSVHRRRVHATTVVVARWGAVH